MGVILVIAQPVVLVHAGWQLSLHTGIHDESANMFLFAAP